MSEDRDPEQAPVKRTRQNQAAMRESFMWSSRVISKSRSRCNLRGAGTGVSLRFGGTKTDVPVPQTGGFGFVVLKQFELSSAQSFTNHPPTGSCS